MRPALNSFNECSHGYISIDDWPDWRSISTGHITAVSNYSDASIGVPHFCGVPKRNSTCTDADGCMDEKLNPSHCAQSYIARLIQFYPNLKACHSWKRNRTLMQSSGSSNLKCTCGYSKLGALDSYQQKGQHCSYRSWLQASTVLVNLVVADQATQS